MTHGKSNMMKAHRINSIILVVLAVLHMIGGFLMFYKF